MLLKEEQKGGPEHHRDERDEVCPVYLSRQTTPSYLGNKTLSWFYSARWVGNSFPNPNQNQVYCTHLSKSVPSQAPRKTSKKSNSLGSQKVSHSLLSLLWLKAEKKIQTIKPEETHLANCTSRKKFLLNVMMQQSRDPQSRIFYYSLHLNAELQMSQACQVQCRQDWSPKQASTEKDEREVIHWFSDFRIHMGL